MPRLNLAEDIGPRPGQANVTHHSQTRPAPIGDHPQRQIDAVLLGVAEYERLLRKMEVLEDIRLPRIARARGGVA